MLTLKQYQQRALDALKGYFAECVRTGDADLAFYSTTRALSGTGIQYTPVTELPGLPYVCLRLPTGGGKTLLACHAAGAAISGLVQAERAVVLWLVPSNAIREQTLTALRDRRHPYRQALDSVTGPIRVLSIDEALYVNRPDLDGYTTIIVSTMQAFRVDDTDGRKVYESSGSLMDHFPEGLPGLLDIVERGWGGRIVYSLANVLRLRRPVVIVDEAHNSRTPLSFETLARFNPACILEFTATPATLDHPSNVLYSVSAAELHAESMIKMPINLETRPDWKALLADAIALRGRLETAAAEERRMTGERIRPIMLIQAQPDRKDRESITVEVLERHLLKECRIHPAQVRRATGTDHGLDGVNLMDPDCEVRFVITVQALREGWDCPFAYVLCSVAEMNSPTAVEQILGRVMRLPRAARKTKPELNGAYAFVKSRNFADAARTLTDALVQCHGFDRLEAADFVKRGNLSTETQGPLWEGRNLFRPSSTVVVLERPSLTGLPPELKSRVEIDDGGNRLTFFGRMTDLDRDALEGAFATDAGKSALGTLFSMSQHHAPEEVGTPSERGESLSVPLLAVKQGSFMEELDESYFMTEPLRLCGFDSSLSDAEFPAQGIEGERGEINVTEEGHLRYRFLSELHQQVSALDADASWSLPELAHWLDRHIPHPDISPIESGPFIAQVLRGLVDGRGIPLERLVHDRYRLKVAVTEKIDGCRRQARESSYQALLLPECATPIVVDPAVCFTFPPSEYPYSARCDPNCVFNKHYYPHVGNLKVQGEEYDCAHYLDSHAKVRYWVRNLERRPAHSFSLQTSTDRFYPDFVCMLKDGRYLVVEFKGEHLWSNDDSKEKRDIGGLWEARSEGRCLFVMPRGRNFGEIDAKIG